MAACGRKLHVGKGEIVWVCDLPEGHDGVPHPHGLDGFLHSTDGELWHDPDDEPRTPGDSH